MLCCNMYNSSMYCNGRSKTCGVVQGQAFLPSARKFFLREAACPPTRRTCALPGEAASNSWHAALGKSSFDPVPYLLSHIDLPRYDVLH